MRKECKMVYTYDELDEAAKQKARDWWAQHVFEDSCDWEFVYGELLGKMTFDTRPAANACFKQWRDELAEDLA